MDRIVRYVFGAAAIVLTLGWLGSVAKGYLPSSPPNQDDRGFNAPADQQCWIGRPKLAAGLPLVPLPSLHRIAVWQKKHQATDQLTPRPAQQSPAVLR
jgi:hypothetical protein